GEYWDQQEDSLSTELGPSRFAGGSRVLQAGLLSHRSPFWASVAALILALAVALVLQLGYRTGPLTVPFCILGLLGGFFYSTRPIRWVATGVGELWIAFCYGWLPIAVGYYLQVGEIASIVHWMALPVGLTILNVILLNEYPDHPADAAAGKANLAVRLGLKRASLLYTVFSIGSWMALLLSVYQGVPPLALALYVPVLVLSVSLVILVLKERWRDRATLERLCGANLLVNLGTTAVYILALVS
ncbi:MAG TPA: prenyltransferase, partial [Chloroflexi bacterium]|nr:prenyltransferase [Chloroflexota bacterium]